MFSFEQIAVRTSDIDASALVLGAQGHLNWVQDEVVAVHLYTHPSFDLGRDFHVRLAFNYEIFPGMEYELIQLLSGKTVQLGGPVQGLTSISHWGYHVNDQPEVGSDQPDSLVQELRMLRDKGLLISQVSQTVHHTNTSKRYRYAFAFLPAIGAPVKVIQRLQKGASVETGVEQFAWL